MPIMRVSTSVALSSLRTAGSFGTALVALGAAEVMLPPDLHPCAAATVMAGDVATEGRAALRTARPSFVSFHQDTVNSLAERRHLRLHAGADFRLGDPAFVDDDVEIVLGDGQRRQQDAVDLDALGAAREGFHHLDFAHLLAACER